MHRSKTKRARVLQATADGLRSDLRPRRLAAVLLILVVGFIGLAVSPNVIAQGNRGYQQLAPPPSTLPTEPLPSVPNPSNHAQATVVPDQIVTQPQTQGSYFEGPNAEVDDFNGFELSVNDKIKLHPWQTWDIPIGSYGSAGTWNPEQLGGTTIERFRKSFVQKVQLSGGYVARDGNDGFGYSFAGAAATMVAPLGSMDNVLAFTPQYRNDWLDGPRSLDVPARLQTFSMDIGIRTVFNSQWSTIIGLRPGYFNDLNAQADGFRLGGLALVNYKMIPDVLTLTLGVVYLDRNDFNLIPAFGLTWIPDGDTRYELTFPKMRVAKRIGHLPYMLEDWVYIAASLGGGTYAVQRTTGVDDELSFRDFRIAVGYERMLNGGTGYFFDVGYVFQRKLEYEIGGEVLRFGDSFILEAGLSF